MRKNISTKEKETNFLVLKGEKVPERIGKILTTTTQTLTGFTFNTLANWTDCVRIDPEGKLVKNDYIKTVLRVGDKFVFPGDDESIALVRDLLNRFPFLQDKLQPRWIDPSKLDIRMNFFAFDEKVIFYSGSGSSIRGVLIKNKSLAQSFRSLCLFLWENANSIS